MKAYSITKEQQAELEDAYMYIEPESGDLMNLGDCLVYSYVRYSMLDINLCHLGSYTTIEECLQNQRSDVAYGIPDPIPTELFNRLLAVCTYIKLYIGEGESYIQGDFK